MFSIIFPTAIYLFVIYCAPIYNGIQTKWCKKCIVLLLVGLIFILGIKIIETCITQFFRGFIQTKWCPVSYQQLVSFSQMLRDSHKALTIVQTLSKTPNMSSAMFTHPCWQKAYSSRTRTTSGLRTSQRASWYIYCAHAQKIITVNLVLAVHLQSGVKTRTPTDCKTLHINLLVTKHSKSDVINAAVLTQTQKRHYGPYIMDAGARKWGLKTSESYQKYLKLTN